MYWEIAGHVIALTGDGYYDDEGWTDEWLILRCLACPGHDGRCNHLLFLTEEDPMYDRDGNLIDPLYPRPMLEGVLGHLLDEGVPITPEIIQTARTMTALANEWTVGIDMLYESLGGGVRRVVR